MQDASLHGSGISSVSNRIKYAENLEAIAISDVRLGGWSWLLCQFSSLKLVGTSSNDFLVTGEVVCIQVVIQQLYE